MVREGVPEASLALELGPEPTQLGLRMMRRGGDTELSHLLVGHRCHPTPLHQRHAVDRLGPDEPERAVADPADHTVGAVGSRDLATELLGEPQIERCTPSASEKDDVVVGHVQIADRQRLAHFGPELIVGEEAVARCGTQRWAQRLGLDRNHTALGTGNVDVHSGIEERVVRHGHLAGEDAGRLADVEHTMVGGDDQGPTSGQVDVDGLGVLGMHADALEELAQGTSRWRWLLHGRASGRGSGGVGPGFVAFGNGPVTLGSEPLGQLVEDCGNVGIVPAVLGLDRIGVEVVELPLVGERLGAIPVASGSGAGEMPHPGLGPGCRVIEAAHELPERPIHSADDALEVGRDVGRHLDPQWGRLLGDPPHAARQATGPRVAFGHVVARDRVHGAVHVGRSAVDDRHEVAPRKRVQLAERSAKALGGFRFVDGCRPQQGGHEVDVRRRRVGDDPPGARSLSDPGDDERNASRLVVQVEPLLVEPAVGPEQLAVIRRTHQHCVAGPSVGDRSAHPVEGAVDREMEPVVEVAVVLRPIGVGPFDQRPRPVGRRVRSAISDLGRRLRGEVFVVGRRRWYVGWKVGVAVERVVGTESAEPPRCVDDVVGVHETDDEQERALCIDVARTPSLVAVLEPGDRTVGIDRVAHETGAAGVPSVGLGADPAGEAELVEHVGVEVGPYRCVVETTSGVVGPECVAGRRVEQVGVGHVPFADVVGVVAAGTEPVPERRHLARAEPTHPGVVVHLAEAVGLGHPVDVRVLPGEERRTARHAGE